MLNLLNPIVIACPFTKAVEAQKPTPRLAVGDSVKIILLARKLFFDGVINNFMPSLSRQVIKGLIFFEVTKNLRRTHSYLPFFECHLHDLLLSVAKTSTLALFLVFLVLHNALPIVGIL